MKLEWSHGPLAEGLACYRREEFFEAHEHWEIVWKGCQGPEKSLLQALIQMAGAFHHLQRRNGKGAVALLEGSLRRLDAYPAQAAGLDLARLRTELRGCRQLLESVELPARLPYPGLLPALLPAAGGEAPVEDSQE